MPYCGESAAVFAADNERVAAGYGVALASPDIGVEVGGLTSDGRSPFETPLGIAVSIPPAMRSRAVDTLAGRVWARAGRLDMGRNDEEDDFDDYDDGDDDDDDDLDDLDEDDDDFDDVDEDNEGPDV